MKALNPKMKNEHNRLPLVLVKLRLEMCRVVVLSPSPSSYLQE
jgi:hypothetical protein